METHRVRRAPRRVSTIGSPRGLRVAREYNAQHRVTAAVGVAFLEPGGTYRVTTPDGHVLTGKAGYVGPLEAWLYHPAGVHVVRLAALERVERIRPNG